MKDRFFIILIVVLIITLLVDLYSFKGIKLLVKDYDSKIRTVTYILFWGFTVFFVLFSGYVYLNFSSISASRNYFFFFTLFTLSILNFFPKLIFSLGHLVDDIAHGIKLLISKPKTEGELISRSDFITKIALILAAIPFFSILYGMLVGRLKFRVETAKVPIQNLPNSFEGVKIVHISDMHIGSFFNNYKAVQKGIDMINELEPDYVFFTGDIVNNYASELDGWIPYLSEIKAKRGKYSIFGNHDYGDYVKWNSEQEKRANLEQLKKYHKEAGFRLLLNENVKLTQKSEEINLLGIENWGMGGFAKYGDLNKAMQGINTNVPSILLSHDPSHWDEQVVGKTNIDLALAGHTHGMQFGVEIAGIKWSPVKYRYPRWGGLYSEGSQHIYVNRGFGYLGMAARIGMPPEITLLELKKA